jgi:hypothetical protein
MKIIWSPDLDSQDMVIMALLVDGVNYSAWEKKHPPITQQGPQLL